MHTTLQGGEMQKQLLRVLALGILAVGVLAFPLVAGAGHKADPRTENLRPKGHIFEPAVLGGFGGARKP